MNSMDYNSLHPYIQLIYRESIVLFPLSCIAIRIIIKVKGREDGEGRLVLRV